MNCENNKIDLLKNINVGISVFLLIIMDWWLHGAIAYGTIDMYFEKTLTSYIIYFIFVFYIIYGLLIMCYVCINLKYGWLRRFKFMGVVLCTSIVYIFFSIVVTVIYLSVSDVFFRNEFDLFLTASGQYEPQPYFGYSIIYLLIALCGACFYRVLK